MSGFPLAKCVTLTAVLLAAALPAAAATPRAGGRSSVPESLQVLVRVGKETITRADVLRRLEELPEQARPTYATPDGKKQLLDRLVEERVWMQTAARKGVAKRPEMLRQLEQARRDLLIRTYLNEVMAANPAPSDSEARVYYDAHLAEYKLPGTVAVRHVQSKSETEAKRVLGWARAGQDFAKLAQKYSADSLTRGSGGALGTVTRDGMFGALGAQPALAEFAFTLETGKVGGPIRTERGWHVLKVDSKTEETVRAFEQVRPVIQRQLSSQKSQDYYRTKLDEARRDLGVTPDSVTIRAFISAKQSARDLFKEAQEAGAPADRVGKYRDLLKQHPKSEVSAQAQFMIGFIYSEELRNYDEAEKEFRLLLKNYPQSELAASAQWMVDHMRTEDAPSFLNLEADSTRGVVPRKGARGKP
ncbi:MAG: peptidyl-prolyl cis-trans isomerase [Candidatus Eisenbacteria bacterium]